MVKDVCANVALLIKSIYDGQTIGQMVQADKNLSDLVSNLLQGLRPEEKSQFLHILDRLTIDIKDVSDLAGVFCLL